MLRVLDLGIAQSWRSWRWGIMASRCAAEQCASMPGRARFRLPCASASCSALSWQRPAMSAFPMLLATAAQQNDTQLGGWHGLAPRTSG